VPRTANDQSGRPPLLPEAIGVVHLLHPRGLVGCEVVHAGIVRVIHEVLYRVPATASARVTSEGAAVRGGFLGRGVNRKVAAALAASLEGVVESQPVPNLVREQLQQ
jgi:hypothetical protein